MMEQAIAERAAIVAKYKRGRVEDSSDSVVPPWEDPQYEEYHVTDKFGFIQWVLPWEDPQYTPNKYMYIYV